MKKIVSFVFALVYLSSIGFAAENTSKRKALLDEMLRIFPKSEAWEQWLEKTGELPPDFDAMPNIPYLPDPVSSGEYRKLMNSEWPKQREKFVKHIKHYITGTAPPPPGNVRVKRDEERKEKNLTIHNMTLEFGPDHKVTLDMQLLIPDGEGPFPVFITQDNHYRWALIAASRGYIACVYAGADSHDDTSAFVPVWPEYDWTKLTRRAWAASRCLDYIFTIPYVDRTAVCLTGHSRNGKLSIIGGVLDERFTAIISSSSGAGGACSYRLFSEVQFGEGIELLTRVFPDWMHPRLRFFTGRENKLPIDQNTLIACIAPRSCLISTALNDPVESVWAIEQTYHSAKKAYKFLKAPFAFQLRYRAGSHETQADDIEAYIDWLDTQFKRKSITIRQSTIYPTYDEWIERRSSKEILEPDRLFPRADMNSMLSKVSGKEDWAVKKKRIIQNIEWALGDAPPAGHSVGTYGTERTYLASLLSRADESKSIKKMQFNFGNYISADLYHPAGAEKEKTKKIPAVIWLHSIFNARGYVPSYRRGASPHVTMAKEGFAVLCFDQIGNGYRLEEVTDFYNRYHHWSILGKMVTDTRASIDVLEQIPFIDTNRIFVAGYAVGGMLGLHATALDERIAGAVSVAGFTPMRLDTEDKGTGGIARWSQWMLLLPRLGKFTGQENRLPYDYHEIMAAIAPRPVVAIAPRIDYGATLEDIRACVDEANKVYDLLDAKRNVQLIEVDDYNRFSPELQKQTVIPALKRLAGIE